MLLPILKYGMPAYTERLKISVSNVYSNYTTFHGNFTMIKHQKLNLYCLPV